MEIRLKRLLLHLIRPPFNRTYIPFRTQPTIFSRPIIPYRVLSL
jgi:hypothetical protein